MSKVLVDRELLERIANDDEGAASLGDFEELKQLLAQPAEAEGVEVPVEGYILDNNGYSFTRRREDFWTAKAAIVPLVRQSDHLAALSAVTAERDRLRNCLRTEVEAGDSWKREAQELRDEVEALRGALQDISVRASECECRHVPGSYEQRKFADIAFRADAAMAAKEA